MFSINSQIFELTEEETKYRINRKTYTLRKCVNKRMLVKCLLSDASTVWGNTQSPDFFKCEGEDIKEMNAWERLTKNRKENFDPEEFLNNLTITILVVKSPFKYFNNLCFVFENENWNFSRKIDTGYFNPSFQEEYIQKTLKPRLNLIGWRMARRAEMGLGR